MSKISLCWILICNFFSWIAQASEPHTIPLWAPSNTNEMATAGGPRRSCLSNRCRGQWHAGGTIRGGNEGFTKNAPSACREVSPVFLFCLMTDSYSAVVVYLIYQNTKNCTYVCFMWQSWSGHHNFKRARGGLWLWRASQDCWSSHSQSARWPAG